MIDISHNAESQGQMPTEATGAVLVCGAGITGIQASLDLAESGFKVYLLESSPAIGGRMAQLDKTFPTGDCMLAEFGGLCPVTRCAKRMLNGPCGGSSPDHCEVDADRPCIWQAIYERLKGIGQLDRLEAIQPPKNWQPAWHGGARKIIREEHRCAPATSRL